MGVPDMPYPIPDAPVGVDDADWQTAVQSIREYCGWHIAPEITETVTVDAVGSYTQMLPTLRLVDLAEISLNGETVSDPEWSSAGLVRGVAWTRKFGAVSATMTHGYEEWPAELLAVAAASVLASGRGGVSSVASGTHSVRFETSLTEAQVAVLDRYRLMALP